MVDTARVVRCAIHPAIGIARVGDSLHHYVVGPEVPEPRIAAPESFRDATGALKRQAARFRIYGYDAHGAVVGEITTAEAKISWTVHVANTKAAWFQFQIALDVPEAANAAPSRRRNAAVTPRSSLIIDPGKRTVVGGDATKLRFDTGRFRGTKVDLGQAFSEPGGQLLVLGGFGVSSSPDHVALTTFANNDGWHDDTADGPVTATVTLGGRAVPVDPAWVVVAPPNYAPYVKSVRTMHDLLTDTFTAAGTLPAPTKVSFTHDVLPILRRLCDLQWVNHGFAVAYGWSGRQSYLDPDFLAQLAAPGAEFQELRLQVWSSCRSFARDGISTVPWPWIYGDAMTGQAFSPRQHITVTPTQYTMLRRWAHGDFVADYDPHRPAPPGTLAEVPISDQPAALDRAALEFCLADAFHPGCELTWPMRHPTLYAAPFRIRHRSGAETPITAAVLTSKIALSATGPLHAQGPGDLTRWMAVPWQADTASCRSGYAYLQDPQFDPYLPTFWPARVPNHVLTEEDYAVVMDGSRSTAERLSAFRDRATWLRFLPTDRIKGFQTMISHFGDFGLVAPRPGPADLPELPAQVMVETGVGFPTAGVPRLQNLVTVHEPTLAGLTADAEGATAAGVPEVPSWLPPEAVTFSDVDYLDLLTPPPD